MIDGRCTSRLQPPVRLLLLKHLSLRHDLDPPNPNKWVSESQGKYEEAKAMHRQDLEGSEKVLGAEHLDTLISIGNLALTLNRRRQWEEAEILEVRVLKTRKRVLGDIHLDTLMTIHNLTFTLESESRGKEAISLMERCYRLRKDFLGRYHPNTEFSLGTLEEWWIESIETGT
ncbi:hypothetical protein EJ04DRAFT_448104 [Polyplosphaeria fusca]|uniref:Kinesin light chain n=1 Tax=Polyplosphaeria fusca TaxID=682080 RepID=A0A9P4QQ60_9PLEO|nr:hypothetical protein EJ04DRAFT_448104 [Polyplosphaeria fusca]